MYRFRIIGVVNLDIRGPNDYFSGGNKRLETNQKQTIYLRLFHHPHRHLYRRPVTRAQNLDRMAAVRWAVGGKTQVILTVKNETVAWLGVFDQITHSL